MNQEDIEALKEGIQDRQHHIDELLQEMKYMAYCLEELTHEGPTSIGTSKGNTNFIRRFLESRLKDNRNESRFGFCEGVIE